MFNEYFSDYNGSSLIELTGNSWNILLFFCSQYIILITLGYEIMEKQQAFNSLRKYWKYWNLFLSTFSFMGMINTLPYLLDTIYNQGLDYTICEGAMKWYANGNSGVWTALFIYSKIPELMDTVFLILLKRPVTFLHWYHHLSVLVYCWHAFSVSSSSGLWFVSMNYTVHSIMYLYYFLAISKRIPTWFKPFWITYLQILQMVVGVSVNTYIVYKKVTHGSDSCEVPNTNMFISLFIYSSYFTLFVKFFINRFYSIKKD